MHCNSCMMVHACRNTVDKQRLQSPICRDRSIHIFQNMIPWPKPSSKGFLGEWANLVRIVNKESLHIWNLCEYIYIYIIFINIYIYIHIITRGTDCSPNVPLKLSSWSTPRFVKCKRTTQKIKVCSGQLGLSCDWIYVCCDVQGSEEKEHTHIYIYSLLGAHQTIILIWFYLEASRPTESGLRSIELSQPPDELVQINSHGFSNKKGKFEPIGNCGICDMFPTACHPAMGSS